MPTIIFGTEEADSLAGPAGADTVFQAGGGDDIMAGGSGRDTFIGGAGMDTVSYVSAPGSVRLDLSGASLNDLGYAAGDSFVSVENAIGSAFRDVIVGAPSANRLEGGGGADRLSGLGGDDLLVGGAGRDRLDGGSDADRLAGGAGADTLTGGLGADTFALGARDSRVDAPDLITDLDATDTIDLGAMDADKGQRGDQAFHLAAGFTGHAGELVLGFDSDSGLTSIAGDVDGDGAADFRLLASGDHHDFTNFIL